MSVLGKELAGKGADGGSESKLGAGGPEGAVP